jgi:2-hydroxychromene-2-carboxylate isomerase
MSGPMPMPAFWYFDIISPFAHVALARLTEIERMRPVVLKPIVLGAVLKAWGQLGPAEIAPKRIHTYRLVTHLAASAGTPFRFPQAHPFNPLAMLRLLTALDGRPAAVRAAFDLVWGQGRDANDPEVLAEVARRAGDPDAVSRIGEQQVKDALRRATEEAIAAGVFGVPSLVIDGEIFWGVDAMAMALDYLRDPAGFMAGEMARVSSLPVGVQREVAR